MDTAELLGYLAALLVFTTFYMKTMLRLRIIAICSNLAFIAYGYADHLHPVLLLHSLLLPLNTLRLVQIIRLLHSVGEVEHDRFPFEELLPYMERRTLTAGQYLFRAGDEANAMYYVAEGEVLLGENGPVLGRGDILGEIGALSPAPT